MTLTLEPKLIEAIQADIEITLISPDTLKKDPDADLLIALGYKVEDAAIQLLPEKRRMLVSVVKNDVQSLQITASKAIKELQKYHYKSAKIDTLFFHDDAAFKAFCEGFYLGDYVFDKYKSKKKEIKLKNIIMSFDQTQHQNYPALLLEATVTAKATNFTRDIVNTTPEELYPKQMAKIASELAKEVGLSFDVLDEDQFLDQGMEAMYMVGRASRHDSQLIHLSHKPKNPKAIISLIGKGLTYDSGGLSLKPADSMVTMKLDKSGGAAVLGIMKAAALLKLPVEIHGFIGAVENMIGGDAYKPDDVLTAKNGTTIEVRNTDAEGRLVLADVLCYAQEKVKADYIFDYATLTGACVVALGLYTTGVMGHNSSLKRQIFHASHASGELTGALPFNDHLKEELKSEVADIKNVTGRWGGAITAGLFLDTFIKEENKDKWVHFDIAGPAYTEKPWGVNGYGGTGAGVRLTLALIQELLQEKKG